MAPSMVLLLNTPFSLLPMRLIPNDSPRFGGFLQVHRRFAAEWKGESVGQTGNTANHPKKKKKQERKRAAQVLGLIRAWWGTAAKWRCSHQISDSNVCKTHCKDQDSFKVTHKNGLNPKAQAQHHTKCKAWWTSKEKHADQSRQMMSLSGKTHVLDADLRTDLTRQKARLEPKC